MSLVDDLSEVVDDGVLSEAFSIQRSTGSFTLGGWKTESSTVPGWGVVSVASPQDLDMLAEADRVEGMMVFHTKKRIYETQLDINVGAPGEIQRVSDIMIWNYVQWRILKVWPYPNRTFWKAIGARLQGN